jgi:hypothetical protein
MTAKEKVLAVWPDSHVYINKILRKWMWYRDSDPDAVSPMFETEEAAWQNAAESLPAESEHYPCENPNCQMCAKYRFNAGPEPVAPVGAKDDDPLGIKAALRMTRGHLELSKPHPDSSSIPDEQTFEEWKQATHPHADRVTGVFMREAWNAAKGQR